MTEIHKHALLHGCFSDIFTKPVFCTYVIKSILSIVLLIFCCCRPRNPRRFSSPTNTIWRSHNDSRWSFKIHV